MLSALLSSKIIGEIVMNINLLKKLIILTKVKAQHPYL